MRRAARKNKSIINQRKYNEKRESLQHRKEYLGDVQMGQLIKLQDYISRYEQDTYRYPGRFIRLKQQQWEKLKEAFQAGDAGKAFIIDPEEPEEQQPNKKGIASRLRRFLKKEPVMTEETEETEEEKREGILDYERIRPDTADNLDELKQSFLNQLLRIQLKWASSTMLEKSFMDQSYLFDERLRFFLQRLPDTVLVLYKPVFLLKNAPVEGEVILLTPTEAWCISFLEEEEEAAFSGSGERFWTRRHHRYPEKKILNPQLGVNRMAAILGKLFSIEETALPVRKAILSRNGYIDYPLAPHDLTLLDKRSFPDWFARMRSSSAPLKHQQLKAAQVLLDYCQTTSSRRVDWDAEMEEEEDTGGNR